MDKVFLLIAGLLVAVLLSLGGGPAPHGQAAAETTHATETLNQIYFQISLNVNYSSDPAEQRAIAATIRRHLALMERYNIKGNYYFTGLAAEMLQEIDPGLIELLRTRAAEGKITINHHGANRLPHPMPLERVHGRDWEQDVQAILDYESCALDPRAGALDCSRSGGLKRMTEEIFNQEIFSTGRFFQASILHVAKLFGVRMAVGLQDNIGAPRGDAWFLGILNRPDSVGIIPQMVIRWARGGPSPLPELERKIAALDKNRIRLISLLIHDHDFFRGRSAAQTEQIWQKYEAAIRRALERGYTVVSLRNIYEMARDDRERTISETDLKKIAEFYVAQVEAGPPHYPPDYINLGDDYFSLADAWQALAQALAGYTATGALPEHVQIQDTLGPTKLVHLEMGPQAVSAADILESAVAAVAELRDRMPTTIRLPELGSEINTAEHLYLLAREYLALLEKGPGPVQLLPIRLVAKDIEEIGTRPGDSRLRKADPLTKQQFWTFKPVRWK